MSLWWYGNWNIQFSCFLQHSLWWQFWNSNIESSLVIPCHSTFLLNMECASKLNFDWNCRNGSIETKKTTKFDDVSIYWLDSINWVYTHFATLIYFFCSTPLANKLISPDLFKFLREIAYCRFETATWPHTHTMQSKCSTEILLSINWLGG